MEIAETVKMKETEEMDKVKVSESMNKGEK